MLTKSPRSTLIATLAIVWTFTAPLAASRVFPDRPFQLNKDLPTTRNCDGAPPKLVNEDATGYEYILTCGNKVERDTIPAVSTRELKAKSGCLIKLGENKATKLYADMVCTVKSAKITCDLL